MKIHAPNFFIVNPDLIIITKIPKWWFEDRFQLSYNLIINTYKRLNSEVCKRILNEYKRLKSDNSSDYQMVEKNIGIAPMGGLRI